jgi:3-phenylpropionate/trans-cinnamate dioxygenase ferredoxin subunit
MTGEPKPVATPAYTPVFKLADLPVGGRKTVTIGGRCVLVCNAGGTLHAISNVCSHAEKPLERGRIGNGWIACPAHGARFELATGKAINLPATQPIATYDVRVVEDWIEVLV